MFRDEAQTHLALRTLLETLPGLGRMWTETGPTEEAARLVERRGGAVAAGETLLVMVAFDLWNGQGHADFGRMVATLSAEPLAALGALLVVMGNPDPAAIDRWITRYRRGAPSMPA